MSNTSVNWVYNSILRPAFIYEINAANPDIRVCAELYVGLLYCRYYMEDTEIHHGTEILDLFDGELPVDPRALLEAWVTGIPGTRDRINRMLAQANYDPSGDGDKENVDPNVMFGGMMPSGQPNVTGNVFGIAPAVGGFQQYQAYIQQFPNAGILPPPVFHPDPNIIVRPPRIPR
jgi:hypothetical protein